MIKVIAENLSEEDLKGLQHTFKNIDTDQSGTITLEELKTGLRRLGSKLTEDEIKQLMDAVRLQCNLLFLSPAPKKSLKRSFSVTGRCRQEWDYRLH